jgi:hypothetical protein
MLASTSTTMMNGRAQRRRDRGQSGCARDTVSHVLRKNHLAAESEGAEVVRVAGASSACTPRTR